MGQLRNIRIIHLQYNRLKGSITQDIVPMDKIRVFDVSHNPELGGIIPEQIIDLTWATVSDVPDIVGMTVDLAQTNFYSDTYGGSWAYSSEIALIEEFEHSRQAPYLCCIHLHSFVSTNNILTI
eukprot:s2949_g7.t1